MRVLAIGAHPDDVDILCGGTLAWAAQAGHDVWIAIATNGNVGSPTLSRGEIATIRRDEAARSCAVIGANLMWMDFEDEWLFNDRPTRTRFIDAIRESRPDLVIAHSTTDYHPDHRIAGQVALDARIPSAVRLVETALPALDTVPEMLLMDTVGAVDFEPDLYIDITEFFDTKLTMIRAHASQKAWLEQIYGMAYLDFVSEQARRRGVGCGVRYAEAFQRVRTYPPPTENLPLPALSP